MKTPEKWAIVTSNEIRHRYLANKLGTMPQVGAVISEPKMRNPARLFANVEEEKLLGEYFQNRSASERSVLSEGINWNLSSKVSLFELGQTSINETSLVEQLWNLDIRRCIIFGTSLLKNPWLEHFGGKMINLHLGLSPYYRGAGTNFWALYNKQPQCVGATLHLIDSGVDSGPIIQHIRPDPERHDDAHSLGNKVIAKSVDALAEVIANPDQFEPVPQWFEPNGREYKMKDFGARALTAMLKSVENGLIQRYASEPDSFDTMPIKLIREYKPFSISKKA